MGAVYFRVTILQELADNVIGYPGFFPNDGPYLGTVGAAKQFVNNSRISYNCYS